MAKVPVRSASILFRAHIFLSILIGGKLTTPRSAIWLTSFVDGVVSAVFSYKTVERFDKNRFMTQSTPILTPRLVVQGAAAAIEMYTRVLGAECLERFAGPDGQIVHAALSVRGAIFAVVDDDGVHNLGPQPERPSSVILHLMVDDPDGVAAALVEAGGQMLIPVEDRFYGYREGRVADRFGHLWILSRKIEALEKEEIERRLHHAQDT